MKELTEEQLEAIYTAWNNDGGSESVFTEHLKEQGLVKEELEVGKWYKYSDSEGFLFCLTNVETTGVEVYGFVSWRYWIDEGKYISEYLIPATDKEVKEALIKEAKKRGFKEGVKANLKKCDNSFSNNVKIKNNNFRHSINQNWLAIDGFIIFKDGKWAEIIEEKKEIVVNGVTYIEK